MRPGLSPAAPPREVPYRTGERPPIRRAPLCFLYGRSWIGFPRLCRRRWSVRHAGSPDNPRPSPGRWSPCRSATPVQPPWPAAAPPRDRAGGGPASSLGVRRRAGPDRTGSNLVVSGERPAGHRRADVRRGGASGKPASGRTGARVQGRPRTPGTKESGEGGSIVWAAPREGSAGYNRRLVRRDLRQDRPIDLQVSPHELERRERQQLPERHVGEPVGLPQLE